MRYAALAALLLLAAAPAGAQEIRAGMTADQVRAAFGAPARTREQGNWTYYFYSNGCPVRCGSDDVVFLQDGRVVAAVLRTEARRFAGPSASAALGGIDPAMMESGMVRAPARARSATTAHRHRATTAATRRATRRRTAAARQQAPVRMRIRHVGGAAPSEDASGRTIVTGRAGAGGQPSTVTGVRVETPNRRMGAARDSAGMPIETTSDSTNAVDQRRIERERRVTPRVVPPPKAGVTP